MFSSSNFKYTALRSALPLPPPYVNPQYYVNPTTLGTGDGLSAANACQVSAVWAKISGIVGPYVNMLDGTYTGANSMIAPPAFLNGISGQPILIRAVNEGNVLIDGQGVRQPINLLNNSYWILQGMNCTVGQTNLGISNSSCIDITNGTQVIVRRVCAWDVPINFNNRVISASGTASYITFEDCAGWGTGRKIFEASQGPDHITFRRCWARWEGSINLGPKLVFEGIYNSTNQLNENCLGTWSAALIPSTYDLQNNGVVIGPTYTSYTVEGSPTDFGHSNAYVDGTHLSPVKQYGNIMYLNAAPTNPNPPAYFYLVNGTDDITFKDTCAYSGAGLGVGRRGYLLCDIGTCPIVPPAVTCSGNCGTSNSSALAATNITGFGNAVADVFAPSWHRTNYLQGASPAAVYSGTGPDGIHVESLYNTSRGAQIRYRYVDGVLTSTALWPWPMSARILAATTSSGHAPADIDTEVQAMFGTFI